MIRNVILASTAALAMLMAAPGITWAQKNELMVEPATFQLQEDQVLPLTVSDGEKKPLTGAQVSWHSSDRDVADVNFGGTVTAKKAGTATITATAGLKTGRATVTVTAIPVVAVEIHPLAVSLEEDQSRTLEVVVKGPVNEDLTRRRTVAWFSDNSTVAEVDPVSRQVTAKKAGTATITATAGLKTGRATVTVTAIPVVAVEVLPSEVSLREDQSRTLEVVVKGPGGKNLTLRRPVAWSSDNAAVAHVDPATGRVTPKGLGVATITASSNGKEGKATITVTAIQVTSLSIQADKTSPPNYTLKDGEAMNLKPRLGYEGGGKPLTDRPVAWSSDNPAVAKVDPVSGRVAAMGPGVANITASTDGKSEVVTVKVITASTDGKSAVATVKVEGIPAPPPPSLQYPASIIGVAIVLATLLYKVIPGAPGGKLSGDRTGPSPRTTGGEEPSIPREDVIQLQQAITNNILKLPDDVRGKLEFSAGSGTPPAEAIRQAPRFISQLSEAMRDISKVARDTDNRITEAVNKEHQKYEPLLLAVSELGTTITNDVSSLQNSVPVKLEFSAAAGTAPSQVIRQAKGLMSQISQVITSLSKEKARLETKLQSQLEKQRQELQEEKGRAVSEERAKLDGLQRAISDELVRPLQALYMDSVPALEESAGSPSSPEPSDHYLLGTLEVLHRRLIADLENRQVDPEVTRSLEATKSAVKASSMNYLNWVEPNGILQYCEEVLGQESSRGLEARAREQFVQGLIAAVRKVYRLK